MALAGALQGRPTLLASRQIRNHMTPRFVPETIARWPLDRLRPCGKVLLAHRLALLHVTGEWPAGHVDHIDGKRFDNHFANLRITTGSENARNSRIRNDNMCGYKGVHFKKRLNKFAAQIHVGGRVRHLGVSKAAVEAHSTYWKAAQEHFGEFARAN